MLHKIIETVDTAARAVGKIARAADTAGGVFATMIAQPETVISVGEPQALDGDDAVAFAARLAQVEAERDEAISRAEKAEGRVVEVESIAMEAESQANAMVAEKIARLAAKPEAEESVSPDVQVVGRAFIMTKFRERLARIEAAEPVDAVTLEAELAHLLTNVGIPNLEGGQEAWKSRAEKAEAAEHACRELRKKDAAERDALAAELAAIRSATGDDPTDDALVRTHDAAQNAALKAIVAPLGARLFEARIAGHRALYNLGRDAARGEVARWREEVARLEGLVDEERRIVTMNADALTAIDNALGRKFSSHDDTVAAVSAAIARAEKADALAAELEEIVAKRDRESAALAELEKTADSIVGFAEAEIGRRMPPAEAWADIATKFRTLKKIARESTQRYAIAYEIAENALTVGLGECERLRARAEGGSSELEWRVKELRELLDESSALCAKRTSERDIARGIADFCRAVAEDALRMGLAECEELRARVAKLATEEANTARFRRKVADAVASMEKATGVSFGSVEEAVNHVRALRERVKDLEAASPATRGQPVATDEELCTIGERAFMGAYSGSTVARYAAYKAVARHVRAERPACLVARAVGSVFSARIVHSIGTSSRWNIHVWPIGESEMKEFGVPSADVPAMFSRMLNLVEARKAVAK